MKKLHWPYAGVLTTATLALLVAACGGGGGIGTAPGAVDLSFGGAGTVYDGGVVRDEFGRSLQIAPNGDLVLGGWVQPAALYPASPQFAPDLGVMRYHSDGSGGFLHVSSGSMDHNQGTDRAYGLIMTPDSLPVLAGERGMSATSATSNMALARMKLDGTADTTFGGASGFTTDTLGFGSSIGRSVTRQVAEPLLGIPYWRYILAGDGVQDMGYGIIVAAYKPDGTLDTTFGTNGKTSINNGSYASKVIFQPDMKILVAGWRNTTGKDNFYITRLLRTGAIDTAFGINGSYEFSSSVSSRDRIYDIALQSGGAIVAVGETGNGVALMRLTPDGAPDATFNGGAWVTNKLQLAEFTSDIAYSVAIQSDGKIVLGGTSLDSAKKSKGWVMRYTADGTLDTGFSGDGVAYAPGIVSGSVFDTEGRSVVLQADGKILLGGTIYLGDANFMITRFHP